MKGEYVGLDVRGEAEGVECLEPAMVGVASLMRRACDKLDIGILRRRCKRSRSSGSGRSRHGSCCCDSRLRGSQRTQATDESARKYVVESDGETQARISPWVFIDDRK